MQIHDKISMCKHLSRFNSFWLINYKKKPRPSLLPKHPIFLVVSIVSFNLVLLMLRYRFQRHWVFFYLEEPASPSEILRKSSTVFIGESHRGYLFNPTWWYSSTAKTALIYLIIKLSVFTKPCWHAWVFLWFGNSLWTFYGCCLQILSKAICP